MQDERIPSRSEHEQSGSLEIGFVVPVASALRFLQLDPFRRHQMPCAAATKFNEGDEGGVCQQRRRFFLRVEPQAMARSRTPSLPTLICSSSGEHSCLKRARRV